jgi:hypothetical protein
MYGAFVVRGHRQKVVVRSGRWRWISIRSLLWRERIVVGKALDLRKEGRNNDVEQEGARESSETEELDYVECS